MSFAKTPYIISSLAVFQEEFELTAVSICAHTRLHSDDHYKINTNPNQTQRLNITFEQHYNKSLMPSLINSYAVLLPNLMAANFTRVSEVKIYVSKQFICYTFFGRDYVKENLKYNMKIVNGCYV